MDAHTAVLIGTLILLLCVLAFVLWRARSTPVRRYEHLDGPADAGRTVRPPRRAVALPVEVRTHVERLVEAGRPARAINLILKQTDLDIDDAHAAVDAIAARVAKPGQAAWQAAKEADKEAARLAKEAGDTPNGEVSAAVSSGLVGLDRATQLTIERMLQSGRLDDAVEEVKEATGMTTAQARATLEVIRAQLQKRNPKPPPRRPPPGGGGRKR